MRIEYKKYIPEKTSHRIAAGIVALTLLWFSLGLVFRLIFGNGEEVLQKEETLFQVEVVDSIAQQKTSELIIRGRTKALRTVTLRAETAGQVISIEHPKGTPIANGDEIARLGLEERKALLDEAKALVDQRHLEYEASKKLESKAFRSKTRVAESKSQLESAQAKLHSIQNSIKDTVIRAPFSGVLNDRYIEIGDYVAVGDSIARLVALDPLLIEAEIAEHDINHMERGRTCQIRLSDKTETEGKITYISSVADPKTRTFEIQLTFDNPNNRVPDGLTAEIYIPTEVVLTHKVSPAILTLNDEGVVGVHAVDDQGYVIFHDVKIISHRQEGLWVANLPERAKIIVVGQDFVKPGQKVKAVLQKASS